MERKDGYLDLDKYFRGFKSTKDLIFESEDRSGQYWLIIEGEKYYFKETSTGLNEIICYELAKIMNIPSVPYDLAIFKDNYGVISKSYRKAECKYVPGFEILKKYYNEKLDILIEMDFDVENAKRNKYGGAKYPYHVQMNNLETIWDAMAYYFNGKDVSKCMIKLVCQFIFSILSGQSDKAAHNWEVEVSKNDINIVDMYDNEESFNMFVTYSEMAVTMHKGDSSLKEVLKDFLEISSSEYINLFLEKYQLLTEENMIKIFNAIETNYNIEVSNSKKDRILNFVRTNRTIIDDVLKRFEIENNYRR